MRDLHRGEGDPAGRRQPEGPRPVRGRGRRGTGGGRGLAVGGRRESDGAALRGAGRAVRACSFVRMGAIPGQARSRATGSSRPSRASTGTGATSIPGSDPTSRRRPEAGEGREELFATRAVAARRSTIREVFDAANRSPMRSVSRSASRASVPRTTSSTERSRRPGRASPATRRTAASRASASCSLPSLPRSTGIRSALIRSSSRPAG